MNEACTENDRHGTSGQPDSPRVLVPPPLIFAGSVAAGLAIDMHLHEFGVPQVFAILLLAAALGLIGDKANPGPGIRAGQGWWCGNAAQPTRLLRSPGLPGSGGPPCF